MLDLLPTSALSAAAVPVEHHNRMMTLVQVRAQYRNCVDAAANVSIEVPFDLEVDRANAEALVTSKQRVQRLSHVPIGH